nr:uncharacterized protein LOC109156800 [Ipomoea batatas]
MVKGYSFFALFFAVAICVSSNTADSVRSGDPFAAVLGKLITETDFLKILENSVACLNDLLVFPSGYLMFFVVVFTLNVISIDGVLNADLAQAPGPANEGLTSTLVLAGNRTKRPDILARFRKYRGGWDIANKHYWASVGFTGAAGFILSVVWFVSFGLALVVHHCIGWSINIKGTESHCSERICLIVLIVLTCTAAIGCILLSVGQDKFHVESLGTLKFVVNQSDYTVLTLRNVTEYLTLAKTVKVAQIFLPSNVMDDIDRLNEDLNDAADMLEEKTNDNSDRIRGVFNVVFIISGWLLVSVTFILCGVFVVIDNAISDTCVAMGEWVDNPHAETALSNILPCVDQRTSNRTLVKSKQVVVDIVNIVNGFIDTYANSNPTDPHNSIYYNQSGPLMPHLCYPYDSQLHDLPCFEQELSMENSSSVWQKYTCNVSATGFCSSIGRLTPDMYGQLVAAVNISYALQHYAPPMLNLQNCNFVRDTFRNITSHHCPPLEHHLRTVNAGLALISVGVMLSLALWMIYANRPQREEAFVKLFFKKNRAPPC